MRDIVRLIVAIDTDQLLILLKLDIGDLLKQRARLVFIVLGNDILRFTTLAKDSPANRCFEHLGLLNGDPLWFYEVAQDHCGKHA